MQLLYRRRRPQCPDRSTRDGRDRVPRQGKRGLTGCAGRVFEIHGAERLTYRVHWRQSIIDVERLAADGTVLDTQHLLPSDFGA